MIVDDTTSTGLTLNNEGMIISYGGTATSTTVNSGGSIHVSYGGVAESTTINNGGIMVVNIGGEAGNTTVESGGKMNIWYSGLASNTLVKTNGSMYCSDYSGHGMHRGELTIENGAVVSFSSNCFIDFTLADRTTSDDYLINDLSLISGSPEYIITVPANQAAGTYKLACGAENFTGSIAIGNSALYYGFVTVNGDDLVYNGVIYSLDEVDGSLTLQISGAPATPPPQSTGSDVSLRGLDVSYQADTMENLTIARRAGMIVNSGGTADNITVYGWLTIDSGTVSNARVESGGKLTSYDGIFRGSLYLADGCDVYLYGAMIDFTVAGRTVEDDYLINNLSGIRYNSDYSEYVPTYTITVDANQASGTYKLAQKASTLTGSISIGDGTTNYGSITVNGDSLSYNNTTYTLTQTNGNLLLNVDASGSSEPIVPPPTSTTVPAVFIYSSGTLVSSGTEINNAIITRDGNDSMQISSGGIVNNTTVSGGSITISSGGTANSTTVKNRNGSMYISSGGTANSTTLRGYMYIYSGGVANNTTINYSAGSMCIYSGGVANNTTINHGVGNMGIYSGGVANNTTIDDGYMDIYSGGVANNTTVNNSVRMYIRSGGVANSTTVNSSGSMYSCSGGVANSTTVNSGGSMFICSEGVANSTTVNSSGSMFISSGGVANSTTVDYGHICISSGGTHRGSLQIAAGATVSAYSGGIIDFTIADRTAADDYLINDLSRISGTPTYTITVSADQAVGEYKLAQGAANFTGTITVGDGTTQYGSITVNGSALTYNNVKYTLTQTNGNLLLNIDKATVPAVFIYSSGTLVSSGVEINNAIIASGRNDSMHISNGGVASDAVVSSDGSINVYNGGVAVQTTIGRYGSMYISSGGIASDTLVDSHGSMYVSKAGLVSSTTVEYGAELYISSGGTAYDAVMEYGGGCTVSSGGSASGIEIKGGGHIIMAVASDTYIQGVSSGSTFEMKNARLDNYTANGGSIYIHSGASANNTRIMSGGMTVRNGGVANNTLARGQVTVLNGGVANYTTAYAGMTVSSGGSANYTVAEKNCYIYISSGGIASNTTINGGRVSAIGTVKDTIVNSGGVLYANSNGNIQNVTLNSGGRLSTTPGSVISSLQVNIGGQLGGFSFAESRYFDLITNGVATVAYHVSVQGSAMTVLNGGTAADITVNSSAHMKISSGGIGLNNTISSYCSITVISGGIVSNTKFSGHGTLYIAGGTAYNTKLVTGGHIYISSRGLAQDTEIGKNGFATVTGNGILSNTILNSGGSMTCSSGGIAANTTIHWGTMSMYNGTHRGSLYIGSAGTVLASGGAIIDFTLTDRTASDDYLINDLARISGTPTYTITVDANQNAGEYKLAQGADSFTGTITIGDGTNNYGKLTVNGATLSYNDTEYTLTKTDGNLLLNVEKIPPAVFIYSRGELTSSGKVLTNATLTEGADDLMYIYNGGTASNAVVKNGGSMCISSGGMAYAPIISGGSVQIMAYGQMDMAVISGGEITVYESGTMTSPVMYGGELHVSSGATLSGVTVSCWTANNTASSWGEVMVYNDAQVKDSFLYDESVMHVFSGGVVSNLTMQNRSKLNLNPELNLYAGASANGVTAKSGARITLQQGAHITSASINNNAYMTLLQGASATSTTIKGGMTVNKNAVAESNIVNVGTMNISGGVVSNTTIQSGGSMNLSSGRAIDTTIAANGSMLTISKGADAINTIQSGGLIWVYGSMDEFTQRGGITHVYKDGSVSGLNFSRGTFTAHSGSIITDTRADMLGSIILSSGSIHRGKLHITNGATVTVAAGAVIDFTLSGRTAEEDYLLNDLTRLNGTPDFTITVSDGQMIGNYKLAQGAESFTGSITISNGTVTYGELTVNGLGISYNDKSYTLTENDGNLHLLISAVTPPENLQGSASGVSWQEIAGVNEYFVQYSTNNFASAITVKTAANAVDTYNLPPESSLWHVRTSDGDWSESMTIAGEERPRQSQLVKSDQDGALDLFFVSANSKWDYGYAASHQGSKGDWNGTGEQVGLSGKNKLEDVFIGSNDANILVLTDDAHGDALFVDDIYSAFPDEIEAQARIAEINEIRAGAGDDVIDLTSQRFEYIGDGVTVYGGLGNDVIWANSGENHLFGDAGNDRIVGGSDNDVIVGGAGNDRMHGGGGNDTFCLGSDWGKDTIEQLADGSVTLWFESGSEDFWNAEAMTYSDGVNSVTIKGITADAVSLKFGDVATALAGAFDSFASEKIFEDQDKALLA